MSEQQLPRERLLTRWAALENERYSDRVVLDAVVPVEREREFLRRVRETFSATVTPESGELISRPVAI